MACCGIPIIKRNACLTVGAYMSLKRRKEYGLGSLAARSLFLGKQLRLLVSDGLPWNLHSWRWVLGVVPVELEHCWGRGPPGIGLSCCPGETRWGAAVAPGLTALSKLWLPLSLYIKCPVETISLLHLLIHSIHSPDLYRWPTQGLALGQAGRCWEPDRPRPLPTPASALLQLVTWSVPKGLHS